MHIDSALQALIDQSVQLPPSAADQTYLGKDSVTPDSTVESKGSQLPVCDFEPPFPMSLPDVHMEPSADKIPMEGCRTMGLALLPSVACNCYIRYCWVLSALSLGCLIKALAP